MSLDIHNDRVLSSGAVWIMGMCLCFTLCMRRLQAAVFLCFLNSEISIYISLIESHHFITSSFRFNRPAVRNQCCQQFFFLSTGNEKLDKIGRILKNLQDLEKLKESSGTLESLVLTSWHKITIPSTACAITKLIESTYWKRESLMMIFNEDAHTRPPRRRRHRWEIWNNGYDLLRLLF